ncbi:hypothetical protein HG536_0C04530 [Torulaspora globosa]|uniref:Uncharacterized protein n=1 Tax=Torulaspora globosa TaxID=48254 RepID=A0A7G3ZFJ8_9SACH|nr:uncharacterized protein HG536_0C04530 [Torulaspora globosa]QLL32284.1 hypothetical protein HG536_0C04530 [Torulaspora globosa]
MVSSGGRHPVARLLRNGRNQRRLDYKEREESDLRADFGLSESESDETAGDGPVEGRIWLQDDTGGDADVDLDSDDETNEQQLNELLQEARLKQHQKEAENEQSDDEIDEMDEATVSSKLKKLNEFVTQSQVYSGVIADTLLERSMQRQGEQKADEPPAKKQKRSVRTITDFFKGKEDTKDAEQSSYSPDDQKIAEQQPSLLKNCILKPYQLEGLNWLITLYENGLNGILADDMGLGKTIESIALLAFIYEMDTKGPFLIAAPLSTVDNWVSEFGRFAPDIPVLKYHHQDGVKARTRMLRKFFKSTGGTGVIVTSYEIIIRDAAHIMSKQWKFLIVDEGHRLKNINCRLIQELKKINTSNRLLLTGTPLQNNLGELWSLLNFILPDIFADFGIFNKWFNFEEVDLQSDSPKLNRLINDELEKNLISNLHTILKPFLLRRLKKNVLAGILPPKREYIINCPLTPMQRKLYRMGLSGKLKRTIFKELVKMFFTLNAKYIGTVSNKSIREYIAYKLKDQETDYEPPNSIMKEMDALYEEHLHKEFSSLKLQNMMMQLRQVVDSTFLFFFPYLEPEDLTLEVLLSTSGKLKVLQSLVPPLIDKGHKVLIFSQFVKMLDLIEDWCELNSLETLRIDGSIDSETRNAQIKRFNNPKDKTNVFLLSTRAAGLGINLAVADTVVLFDSDWNPQVDLQAMDRCHRIGQQKPVIVYRLCCDNTVEHVMLTRAAGKRRLEKLVIQMGQFNTLRKLALNEKSFLQQARGGLSSRATNKELMQELSQLLLSSESSIGFNKTSTIEGDDDGQLTAEEIQELTDRSPKAYTPDRDVQMPHIKLFETSTSQL